MTNSSKSIVPLVLVGIISIAAIILAYWGWREYYILHGPVPAQQASHVSQAAPNPDGAKPAIDNSESGKSWEYSWGQLDQDAYIAVKSLLMGDPYDYLPPGSPLKLYFARWLGFLVTFWAVFAVVYWSFGRSLIRIRARFFKWDHIVVVGSVPFADALSERVITRSSERLSCIQLRGLNDIESSKGRLIRLPFNGLNPKALRSASATSARKIVIASEDDAQAIELSLAVQREFKNHNMVVRMDDAWLARCLHSTPDGKQLRVFSEAGAAAREIVRRHPPFLLAKDFDHARIHLLLAGDHAWIEAIMAEVTMSACTLTYRKPMFTIFTNKPEVFLLRLKGRYPELNLSADVNFANSEYDHQAPQELLWLKEASAAAPFTGAYCAFDNAAHSLAAAVTLRDRGPHIAGFNGPIFVRLSGADSLQRLTPGIRFDTVVLVPFGAMKDITNAAEILSSDTDEAEKAWHNAYRTKLESKGKPADAPWEKLNEEFRMSNRRAVAHINAKLFEAGFDIRPWLAKSRFWDELPTLAPGEKLFRTQEEHARLAELEHERWNADRRMQGWIRGDKRVDALRIHTQMKPFGEVDPDTQQYDFLFIETLDKLLKRGRGGLRRNS